VSRREELERLSKEELIDLVLSLEMRRKSFRRSRELFEELKEAIGPQVQILSMGMSEDWQVAVEEGATMIRLGTVLFGQRKVSPNF